MLRSWTLARTPGTDRALPVLASVRRRSPRRSGALDRGYVQPAAAATLLGVTVTGLHAFQRVRRLRAQGATVRPLSHDVDLPGRPPPRTLVVLGDSAVAGHGLSDPDLALPRLVGRALVARDGRATVVRSVAVDGATTSDVLDRQIGAASDAEVVLLGVGVNDALRAHHRINEVAEALDELLTVLRARARPGARVVLLGCGDLSAAPALPTVLRPVVGWRCRRIAAAQASVAARHEVPVVPVERASLLPAVFGADGFHPGELGHTRLAAAVLDRL